jgi:hypothetical protein
LSHLLESREGPSAVVSNRNLHLTRHPYKGD